MKSLVNWNIFFMLLTASFLSVFAVFPYVITLQGELLKQTGQPVIIIFLLQLFQSVILFSVSIFAGLYLRARVNFPIPILEAIANHGDFARILKKISLISVSLGIATAATIYITDYIFTLGGATISTSKNLAPLWQKLLAAFYGGITEEILMRLFLMTLLSWIGMKVIKSSRPNKIVVIISIVVAAVIFGLGHLPITASLTKLTPLIVIRAVVLNGIGGIVFGWLYWKKGLESAIIAHFTADIFLLSILPLIFK